MRSEASGLWSGSSLRGQISGVSFEGGSVPSPVHKRKLPWIESAISRDQVSLGDSRRLFLELVSVFLDRIFGVSIKDETRPLLCG